MLPPYSATMALPTAPQGGQGKAKKGSATGTTRLPGRFIPQEWDDIPGPRARSMQADVPPPHARLRSNPHIEAVANAENASIWRDTTLRYGGYADEVGEFVTPYTGVVGKFLGYGISSLYCLADMGTTLARKIRSHKDEPVSKTEKTLKIGADMADLGIFHAVATLLIPPMLIGSGVELVSDLLDSEAHIEKSSGLKGALKALPQRGIDAIKPKVRQTIDSALETAAPHLERFAKPGADAFIRRLGPGLGAIAEQCSRIAQGFSRVPGLNRLVDNAMATEMQENASRIRRKTYFTGIELGRLGLKAIPVAIGVGLVPLIAHPFDHLMLQVQNWTNRLLFRQNRLVREDGAVHSRPNPNYWPSLRTASQDRPGVYIPPSSFQAPESHEIFHQMNGKSLVPPPFFNKTFG
jgi:hypothetical protein